MTQNFQAATVEQVAVIGAGTMGRGIAISFANAGINVTLLDLNDDVRAQAMDYIGKIYAQMVERERITQEQMDARLACFSDTGSYADIAHVQLVVEAVYENLALKQTIFRELDRVVNADAILATNTSYLDIDAIAAETSRPEKVLGMHFFSPAHIMKLLEIVRGAKTDPAVLDLVEALGARIGKVAVVAGNCHGFIGNRMLEPYVFQSRRLLLEGALPQQVDQALEAFGMAMGPFRMYDVVGIDLEWRSRQMAEVKFEQGSADELNVRVDDRLCEMERFGQKNGKGYYRYEAGSRQALRDEDVEALVISTSIDAGFERRSISDNEIVERCLLGLINEGARILQEGIASSSADIDKVYLNGYGFPAERGGPMAYADERGIANVYNALKALEAEHGEFFKPAALLQRLAEQQRCFADVNSSDINTESK
ncbi:MAG: 3-hydroxyacyl-CoA dehydrogenase NAD-binding domain-containing protein [Thalassolituus sp.]|uniref:Enoyl-CoA hydratase / Delta(3)-cis-delta(2)-trans-enoyl-CoA isomerase / 3-hydroxyacyl-CoA dehydrogenase / 3-hydroxybutyryl-CoA epimerase n=1 Tax=hydrothermal vent metagenome TaxID=652676 RepID=A0A160TAP9_9ZZZZ|nr:3-hydroxyacyl-CoA dehydrogenase [Thalassolituus oleivorans]PCI47101.1 MAG: 3-hydroxyacyl-CoA dehydrogenase [Oceanospirillales bacterium]PHQ85698.1 MAG: 3-hydroxyacyl-CoA dehydrogenase [Thalassobium sp.]